MSMRIRINLAIVAIEGAIHAGLADGMTNDHDTIKALVECRNRLREMMAL